MAPLQALTLKNSLQIVAISVEPRDTAVPEPEPEAEPEAEPEPEPEAEPEAEYLSLQYASAESPQPSQPFGMNFEASCSESIALQPPAASKLLTHVLQQYAAAWSPQPSQPFGMNFEASWFESIALQPPAASKLLEHVLQFVVPEPEPADRQNDPSASAIWPAATCLLPGPPQPGQVPPGRNAPATGAACPFLTA